MRVLVTAVIQKEPGSLSGSLSGRGSESVPGQETMSQQCFGSQASQSEFLLELRGFHSLFIRHTPEAELHAELHMGFENTI
jgi:hypothetical protein